MVAIVNSIKKTLKNSLQLFHHRVVDQLSNLLVPSRDITLEADNNDTAIA